MKKLILILSMLAILMAFTSCDHPFHKESVDSTSEITSETEKSTTTNRVISQSTLPPLISDEETDTPDDGGSADSSEGTSDLIHDGWFHPETEENTGDNLYVTDDSGFGGEITPPRS